MAGRPGAPYVVPPEESLCTALYGVGPRVESQLRELYQVSTLGDLTAVVRRTVVGARRQRTELAAFLANVARNPRANSCLEGYRVRPFNDRAVRALAAYLRARFTRRELPDAVFPFYVLGSRNPADSPLRPARFGALTPARILWDRRFHVRLVEPTRHQAAALGGRPYPHANPAYEPPAHEIPPPGEVPPYGRDDLLAEAPLRGRRSQRLRNQLLSNDARTESHRRFWPCACFQHAQTCGDFAGGTGARGGNGLPPCRWNADAHQCEAAPPP